MRFRDWFKKPVVPVVPTLPDIVVKVVLKAKYEPIEFFEADVTSFENNPVWLSIAQDAAHMIGETVKTIAGPSSPSNEDLNRLQGDLRTLLWIVEAPKRQLLKLKTREKLAKETRNAEHRS